MSETFTYVFEQNNGAGFIQPDTIVVTVSTPATDSTGYGLGYEVTGVGGTLGSAIITGEAGKGGSFQNLGLFGPDNTIFGSPSSGFSGSMDGIDSAGVAFYSGGNTYDLSYSARFGFDFLIDENGTLSGADLELISTDAPCFCRGTRILTPSGEVPVEQLAIGDAVTTLSGESRPLTWIGSGRSLVTAANPNARPIVVRAGALADGVPCRNLHLTRGHSLLLDGVLIPVEFLINDRSIAWDTTARVVEFYHLELEHHDILLADGAQAESYREDGNRHLFHNADAPRHQRPNMPAYAPVLTSGAQVDAIWARLLARAGGSVAELTDDADLHLLADGVRVDGTADGMVHRFRLDRAPFELRIRSRVCNPTRLGTARDPRDLGVALRRLVLHGDGVELVLGYDSPWLSEGFNGAELAERIRWTTGDSAVPGRVLAAFDGPVELEMELGMTTRYARAAEAALAEARAA